MKVEATGYVRHSRWLLVAFPEGTTVLESFRAGDDNFIRRQNQVEGQMNG